MKHAGASQQQHSTGMDTIPHSSTGHHMLQGDKTLVLQGIFNSSGSELISISNPVMYNRKLSQVTPDEPDGRFLVTITFIGRDSLLVPFDALVAGDRIDQPAVHGFFEIQIPMGNEEMVILRIIERLSGKQLASFRREDIVER